MDRKKLTKLTACALMVLLVGCARKEHAIQFTILTTVLDSGVTSGDTFVAVNKTTKQHEVLLYRVGLAEIDAPERKQPYGQKSRQSLSEICADKRVRITTASDKKDKYNRMLARVSCDGVDANAEQVKRGMAWVDDRYAKDKSLYQLQDEAKAAKRGLWADKKPVAPWEWRRGKR